MTFVFKICRKDEWSAVLASGAYQGSAADQADGFIHLSAAHQVRETAARHFARQADLVIVSIDAEALGEALAWEKSRGGDLFPHLYGPLPFAAVRRVDPLPWVAGRHEFPDVIG